MRGLTAGWVVIAAGLFLYLVGSIGDGPGLLSSAQASAPATPTCTPIPRPPVEDETPTPTPTPTDVPPGNDDVDPCAEDPGSDACYCESNPCDDDPVGGCIGCLPPREPKVGTEETFDLSTVCVLKYKIGDGVDRDGCRYSRYKIVAQRPDANGQCQSGWSQCMASDYTCIGNGG